MGWAPGLRVYNSPAYAPAISLDGGTAVGERVDPSSLPLSTLPLPLKGILFCLLAIFIISRTRSPRQRLPPKPRGLPIIGNLLQLVDRRWLISRECKERFGECRALNPLICKTLT